MRKKREKKKKYIRDRSKSKKGKDGLRTRHCWRDSSIDLLSPLKRVMPLYHGCVRTCVSARRRACQLFPRLRHLELAERISQECRSTS